MITKFSIAAFTAAISMTLSPVTVIGQQQTVTIAAVNNPAMITLKRLSTKFEADNPDIKLNWVVVEENVLRQRVTTDISTGSGQFDLVFLGLYETPIFAKRGWLREITNVPEWYDVNDVFQSLRDGLSVDGKLYALPFYGESSILMYRKDLLEAKGLTMPDQPTYTDIDKIAAALTDKKAGMYGLTLRGKPGWGENMAYLGTIINTFGGSWFDMQWNPRIDTPEWREAIKFYIHLVKSYGPPGASSNGFNECLTLLASGKAAMWIDASAGASALYDIGEKSITDKIGFASAPIAVTPKGANWLWSWQFAIPKAARSPDAAQRFGLWATSKEYIQLVAKETGWATVPPGTRTSTYDSEDYHKAAPFAAVTLRALQKADPTDPCITPVPYQGVQFVGIPEFQSFGSVVGQNIAGALAGHSSVEKALSDSQKAAERSVKRAGYLKTADN